MSEVPLYEYSLQKLVYSENDQKKQGVPKKPLSEFDIEISDHIIEMKFGEPFIAINEKTIDSKKRRKKSYCLFQKFFLWMERSKVA